MIYAHQAEYYSSINAANDAGESTVFVEFMLSTIKASLIDAVDLSDEMSDKNSNKFALRWQKIDAFLQTHEYVMNFNVLELCEVSAATANRILADLVKKKKLIKCCEHGCWIYKANLCNTK